MNGGMLMSEEIKPIEISTAIKIECFYECEECKMAINRYDKYCAGCGKRINWNNGHQPEQQEEKKGDYLGWKHKEDIINYLNCGMSHQRSVIIEIMNRTQADFKMDNEQRQPEQQGEIREMYSWKCLECGERHEGKYITVCPNRKTQPEQQEEPDQPEKWEKRTLRQYIAQHDPETIKAVNNNADGIEQLFARIEKLETRPAKETTEKLKSLQSRLDNIFMQDNEYVTQLLIDIAQTHINIMKGKDCKKY